MTVAGSGSTADEMQGVQDEQGIKGRIPDRLRGNKRERCN